MSWRVGEVVVNEVGEPATVVDGEDYHDGRIVVRRPDRSFEDWNVADHPAARSASKAKVVARSSSGCLLVVVMGLMLAALLR